MTENPGGHLYTQNSLKNDPVLKAAFFRSVWLYNPLKGSTLPPKDNAVQFSFIFSFVFFNILLNASHKVAKEVSGEVGMGSREGVFHTSPTYKKEDRTKKSVKTVLPASVSQKAVPSIMERTRSMVFYDNTGKY